MSFARDDEPNVRYLLRNAELLEELRLSLRPGQSLTQLHDVLSLRAPTLKVLDLEVALIDYYVGVLLARNWKRWRDIIRWKLCPLKSV